MTAKMTVGSGWTHLPVRLSRQEHTPKCRAWQPRRQPRALTDAILCLQMTKGARDD